MLQTLPEYWQTTGNFPKVQQQRRVLQVHDTARLLPTRREKEKKRHPIYSGNGQWGEFKGMYGGLLSRRFIRESGDAERREGGFLFNPVARIVT